MSQPLYLAFIWHMHQPYYRDLVTGACTMPWVRLHATKDYLDMLRRLEAFPNLHQTFNFVPSLLDQLEEYLPPANRSDVFLDISRIPASALSDQQQWFLAKWFFMANHERMIKPWPRYHDLLAKRGPHLEEQDWLMLRKRFRMQDYLDLQVWFNLAWIDPWLRREDPELARLEAKGSQFTEEEKRYVLETHLRLVSEIIPAYRQAAQRGQIELTTSPYYHPILPLLCDLRSAHAALPHLTLPETGFRHAEDARWQLQRGLERHQQAFGMPAAGMWPPEGSVSEEVVRLAIEARVRWIATDEEILWKTLKAPRSPSLLYRPHTLHWKSGQVVIVFRDRELSDLIGFVYSQWDARLAVEDFMKRLGDIQQQFRHASQPALVSVILDGENAWEFYPDDGHAFLTELYHALANAERFRCVTVNEFLQHVPMAHTESLPGLHSGSWIDANFSTWIGHSEKNAAWVHLAHARDALGSVSPRGPSETPAWKSFGIAEGSDWMWWFGDTHFSLQAEEFDRLFRTHLMNSYQLAGLAVPESLRAPIRRQAISPLTHPTGQIHPTIDGRETSYYEWLYAGRLDLRQQYSTIHRGEQYLWRLYYGFDQTQYYFRIDVDSERLQAFSGWAIELAFSHGLRARVTVGEASFVSRDGVSSNLGVPMWAMSRLLELAIPRDWLGVPPGEKLQVTLSLIQGGESLERYPSQDAFELWTSLSELDQAWLV